MWGGWGRQDKLAWGGPVLATVYPLQESQTAERSFVQQSVSRSAENMVASVHPLATEAGVKAFEKGGNAVDAAIATALTLGVVDGFNSGIGGGCFLLIRKPDGQIIAIDGREMAPAAAFRDLYIRDGKADANLSQTGALAMGVPGALAAYYEAATEHGRLRFSDLILPAAEIAETGFEVSATYHSRLVSVRSQLTRFPAAAAILLREDGSAYQIGDRLVQTDLAATYRQIASRGPRWFYNGPFALDVENWSRTHGGIITAGDFANYTTVRRQPLRSRYRGFEIVGFPPPSSGGIHVAQTLNILENFSIRADSTQAYTDSLHIVAESMKRSFADRAHWLGDPDFVNVPRGLLDKAYARELANSIDRRRAAEVLSHGNPPAADADFFSGQTTHVTAADQEGYWVALTTTVNTSFGSKVIIPSRGVIMNNQMDDFSIAPGVPNAFGLVGAESNSVAGKKRPLSSMSPTLVLKDNQPILTVGAAGGPTIINQVICAIVHHLDFGMPIDEAVAAGRWHHQWAPDKLRLESKVPNEVRLELEQRGHVIDQTGSIGITQAIGFDTDTRTFIGVADPRTSGSASGSVPSEANRSGYHDN